MPRDVFIQQLLYEAISKNIEVAAALKAGDFRFDNVAEVYLYLPNEFPKINQKIAIYNESKTTTKKRILAMASLLFQFGIVTIQSKQEKIVDRFQQVVAQDVADKYEIDPTIDRSLERCDVFTLDCPNEETKDMLSNDKSWEDIIFKFNTKEKKTSNNLQEYLDEGNWNDFFTIVYVYILNRTSYLKSENATITELAYKLNLLKAFSCAAGLKVDHETTVKNGLPNIVIETEKKIMIIVVKTHCWPPQRAYEQCTEHMQGKVNGKKKLVICGLSINSERKEKASFRNIHGFYLKELAAKNINHEKVKTIHRGIVVDNEINGQKILPKRDAYGNLIYTWQPPKIVSDDEEFNKVYGGYPEHYEIEYHEFLYKNNKKTFIGKKPEHNDENASIEEVDNNKNEQLVIKRGRGLPRKLAKLSGISQGAKNKNKHK